LEPVTHLLTGACLGRAGLNRTTAFATATMVISAEIPDVDFFLLPLGPITYFEHHRGLTHTLLGTPFDAALTLGVIWGLNRVLVALGRPRKRPIRWPLLFVLACLGGLSHILLDFTNSYGVRPFWPIHGNWYSWDIVHIVEPVITALLLLGLIVPALFSLVQDEIGARARQPRGRAGAIMALVLVVMVWGFRDYQHRRAVSALESFNYRDQAPLRVSAFPYMVDPFTWYAVVETDGYYHTMLVDSRGPEVDPQGRAMARAKPTSTEVVEAAKRSYAGRVYFGWAQYPLSEVEETENGYLVRFYDLRYTYPDSSRRPLRVSVELDRKLNVIEERFGDRIQPRRGSLTPAAPDVSAAALDASRPAGHNGKSRSR
jgi:inner membrane protein